MTTKTKLPMPTTMSISRVDARTHVDVINLLIKLRVDDDDD